MPAVSLHVLCTGWRDVNFPPLTTESLSICAITYGKHHFRPITPDTRRGMEGNAEMLTRKSNRLEELFFIFFVSCRVCGACYFVQLSNRRLTISAIIICFVL